MTTYFILRGAAVLSAAPTKAAAVAIATDNPGARVVVRPPVMHPHWRSRRYWRDFAATYARQL